MASSVGPEAHSDITKGVIAAERPLLSDLLANAFDKLANYAHLTRPSTAERAAAETVLGRVLRSADARGGSGSFRPGDYELALEESGLELDAAAGFVGWQLFKHLERVRNRVKEVGDGRNKGVRRRVKPKKKEGDTKVLSKRSVNFDQCISNKFSNKIE